MGEHTAGPWTVEEIGTHEKFGLLHNIVAPDTPGGTVCEFVATDDAALISAAPDLLAACKVARQELAEWDAEIERLLPEGYEQPRTRDAIRQLDAAIAKAEPQLNHRRVACGDPR